MIRAPARQLSFRPHPGAATLISSPRRPRWTKPPTPRRPPMSSSRPGPPPLPLPALRRQTCSRPLPHSPPAAALPVPQADRGSGTRQQDLRLSPDRPGPRRGRAGPAAPRGSRLRGQHAALCAAGRCGASLRHRAARRAGVAGGLHGPVQDVARGRAVGRARHSFMAGGLPGSLCALDRLGLSRRQPRRVHAHFQPGFQRQLRHPVGRSELVDMAA